jgi:hypothetical protein
VFEPRLPFLSCRLEVALDSTSAAQHLSWLEHFSFTYLAPANTELHVAKTIDISQPV